MGIRNEKQVCMMCSGTGTTLSNEPCSCGATPIDFEELELELTIPKLYKGQSDKVGKNQLVINDDSLDFNEFLRVLSKELPVFPSLFIDTSDTELGAYEVFYAIMEMVKESNNNDILHKLDNMLWVNEVFSEDRFIEVNKGIRRGREDNYNIIISDFEPERYKSLRNQIKLITKSARREMSMYPLNMYHIQIRDK